MLYDIYIKFDGCTWCLHDVVDEEKARELAVDLLGQDCGSADDNGTFGDIDEVKIVISNNEHDYMS